MGRITLWKGRLVGERGFEPPAPTSRTWCSTRLSYSPPQGRGYSHGTPRRQARGFSSLAAARCRSPFQPVWSRPRDGSNATERHKLGRSQAVRHRILIPAFEGSIPSAPATEIFLASKARLENPVPSGREASPGAHFRIRDLTKAIVPRLGRG